MITYIPAQPTLLDDLAWLTRWIADTTVALLRAVGLLPPLDHQPRHSQRPARPEYGADDRYGEQELPELVERVADDRDFGVRRGELVEATVEYTAAEFADATPSVAAAYDATEVALLAGARRLDATDTWAGA